MCGWTDVKLWPLTSIELWEVSHVVGCDAFGLFNSQEQTELGVNKHKREEFVLICGV